MRLGSPSPVARKLSWTPPPPSPPRSQHGGGGGGRVAAASAAAAAAAASAAAADSDDGFEEPDAAESDEHTANYQGFAGVPPPSLARSPAVRGGTARGKRYAHTRPGQRPPLPVSSPPPFAPRGGGGGGSSAAEMYAEGDDEAVSPPTDGMVSLSDTATDESRGTIAAAGHGSSSSTAPPAPSASALRRAAGRRLPRPALRSGSGASTASSTASSMPAGGIDAGAGLPAREEELRCMRDALHARELEAQSATRMKVVMMKQLKELEGLNQDLLSQVDRHKGLRASSSALHRLQEEEMRARLSMVTQAATTHHPFPLLLQLFTSSLQAESETLTGVLEELRCENTLLLEHIEAMQDTCTCGGGRGRSGDGAASPPPSLELLRENEELRRRARELSAQLDRVQAGGGGDGGGSSAEVGELRHDLDRQTTMCAVLQAQLVKESDERRRLEEAMASASASPSQPPSRLVQSSSRGGLSSPEHLGTLLGLAEEQVDTLARELQACRASLAAVSVERDTCVAKLAELQHEGGGGGGGGEASPGLQEADITAAMLRADVAAARDELRGRRQESARASARETSLRREVEKLEEELTEVRAAMAALAEEKAVEAFCAGPGEAGEVARLQAALASSEQRLKTAMAEAQQTRMRLETEQMQYQEGVDAAAQMRMAVTEEKAKHQKLAVSKDTLQQELDRVAQKVTNRSILNLINLGFFVLVSHPFLIPRPHTRPQVASAESKRVSAERQLEEAKAEIQKLKETEEETTHSMRHLESMRNAMTQQAEEVRRDKEQVSPPPPPHALHTPTPPPLVPTTPLSPQATALLTARLEAAERRARLLKEEKAELRRNFDDALRQASSDLREAEATAAHQRADAAAEARRAREVETEARELAGLLRTAEATADTWRTSEQHATQRLSQAEAEAERCRTDARNLQGKLRAATVAAESERAAAAGRRVGEAGLSGIMSEKPSETLEDAASSRSSNLTNGTGDAAVLHETRRLLRAADEALAAERRRVAAGKEKLRSEEAAKEKLSKEVKGLRYKVQVLSMALSADEPPPDVAALSDVVSVPDDASAASGVSGLSSLRHQLRLQGTHIEQLQEGRTAGGGDERGEHAQSFHSMMVHMTELKRRHTGKSGSGASGSGESSNARRVCQAHSEYLACPHPPTHTAGKQCLRRQLAHRPFPAACKRKRRGHRVESGFRSHRLLMFAALRSLSFTCR